MDTADVEQSLFDSLTSFITDHAFAVGLIIGIAFFARRFAVVVVERVIRKTLNSSHFHSKRDEKLREDTLISIINSAIKVVVWILAGMLIMSEVGINVAPLIAGASVIGLAVGFGAQSLVKDLIAGMFILVENQFRVGDVIEVNQGVSGTVEHFTLRATALRDLDGMLHHIPNGIIEIATNKTIDFARVNLDIGVGYDTDIDKLEKIINTVGEDLAADEEWGIHIKEPPRFRRISEFADSAIIVKIVGKTEPIKQWAVTGELRRRLKKAFDKHGIEIPFPQRVIHNPKKPTKK